MNEFNNLSVLPFYPSLSDQNASKWWTYGRIYPLFAPASFLLPFQIIAKLENVTLTPAVYAVEMVSTKGDRITNIQEIAQNIEIINFTDYYLIAYRALTPIVSVDIPEGQYDLRIGIIKGAGDIVPFYSEIFTVVKDITPYLKIEWWDNEDLVFDAGRIMYKHNSLRYKQWLYLDSDVAKPEYIFEEEVEDRDGFTFPIKQISEKKYRFSFFASEYLLDVMRFIRMADYVEITYNGKVFRPDSFLITPEWEANGDVAVVKAEFQTDTVVKKLGVGYLRPTGGQFNNDYNNDYNNLTE